jgi:hypothetical protein
MQRSSLVSPYLVVFTKAALRYHCMYAAFRGSQDIRNWIANLDAFKTPVDLPGCNGCEVHKGFYDAWSEVSAAVLAAVDSFGGMNAPAIHVAGHRCVRVCVGVGVRRILAAFTPLRLCACSLGGALGNLAFIELLVAGYPVRNAILCSSRFSWLHLLLVLACRSTHSMTLDAPASATLLTPPFSQPC